MMRLSFAVDMRFGLAQTNSLWIFFPGKQACHHDEYIIEDHENLFRCHDNFCTIHSEESKKDIRL
jgi:hypothetical protein